MKLQEYFFTTQYNLLYKNVSFSFLISFKSLMVMAIRKIKEGEGIDWVLKEKCRVFIDFSMTYLVIIIIKKRLQLLIQLFSISSLTLKSCLCKVLSRLKPDPEITIRFNLPQVLLFMSKFQLNFETLNMEPINSRSFSL